MPATRIDRGAVCWATLPAGVGHDQGTRPVLVLSRLGTVPAPPRAIVLPISTERPHGLEYPLSWEVPLSWGLARPSWVLVDHIRSTPVDRLRDAFVQASGVELSEVFDAVGELLGADIEIFQR